MSVDTGEFLVVKVKLTDPAVIEEVKEIAFGKYDADGIQEFAIDEARVDEILGERAYSGGDVPEEVIDDTLKMGYEDALVWANAFEEEDLAKCFFRPGTAFGPSDVEADKQDRPEIVAVGLPDSYNLPRR